MKKHFRIFAGITVTALIITSCSTYAQTGNGYYNPDNGNYYSSEYGDGQPGDDYGYNQPPVNNNQSYQYPQSVNGAANQPPVGFNDFYNQLSPFGTWVNIAPYGPVWIANIPNFQPYSTNGYWTYTTYGWTWISNYPWGWAPFHYGRWGYNGRYGWYWVPGYVWGPAWVAWSTSADMYGWAPLMPGMNFRVSLSLNLFPSSYWTFMQGRYMGMNNIGNYYVNRSRNVTIIKNTTIINNYGTENNRRYSMGPNSTDVQRYTGRNIQTVRVSNAPDSKSVGMNNDELRVYRPVSRPASTNNRGATTVPTENNRTTVPQTNKPPIRTTIPQPRQQQQPNQPARRTTIQQTKTQPEQPEMRQTETQRGYRPNSAQPAVTKRSAPQTTKQIQTAVKDNQKVQQRSESTSKRR